jgi:NitT/TauT family transport system substrate-binding protein
MRGVRQSALTFASRISPCSIHRSCAAAVPRLARWPNEASWLTNIGTGILYHLRRCGATKPAAGKAVVGREAELARQSQALGGADRMFVLWIADLDSPSYFVASAAVDLGFFRQEGVDVSLVHGETGPRDMREGRVHFAAGSTYSPTSAFPAWKGLKLLCALSQYSYWFLAVRADLNVKRGDLNALKGLRISASNGFPTIGLRHLIQDAGLDLERDNITLLPPPKPSNEHDYRGRRGVDAIRRDGADGYWGNGMRVAVGEKLGVAKVQLDLRRGDGPPGARFYNFPMLATTDELIRDHPDVAAAAVRAIVKTQKALQADSSLATQVGNHLFPAEEAPLIAPLIERDAPFYDATITQEAVAGVVNVGIRQKLLSTPVSYNELVATQFSGLWRS